MVRTALVVVAVGLTLIGPAEAFEWRAEVSHCEPTLGGLLARHLQCRHNPVGVPCGKIQVVRHDLGGLARFEVLWLTGTRTEVLVGQHDDRLCILASRYIAGGEPG
jgi:hypothetical protein